MMYAYDHIPAARLLGVEFVPTSEDSKFNLNTSGVHRYTSHLCEANAYCALHKNANLQSATHHRIIHGLRRAHGVS